MLLSGDLITPVTIEDGTPVAFLGKPPLQFWLIAASLYLFGNHELAARLPSLLETGVTLFVVFRFASVCLTRAIGFIALLIFMSSLIGFFFAGACMTDPLPAMSVVTTTLALPLSLTLRDLGRHRESQDWEYVLLSHRRPAFCVKDLSRLCS
jgi:4-amino-4-deoxy-L-arabinose transferase-like glycosyltransferase